MSIVAPDGVAAVIDVPGNNEGVDVEAPGATVILKGLTITSELANFNYGISIGNVGALTIDHINISNQSYGVLPQAGFVLIKSSLIDGNGFGVLNQGALVFVGESTISGNGYGLSGAFNSYGDNDLNGNITCDVCKATITESPHDQ